MAIKTKEGFKQLFEQLLLEAKEIGLSKKIQSTLSLEAQDAIESWETMGWVNGRLERSFKANNEIAKEISKAFEPVRQYLKSQYGTKIKLYRGIMNGGEKPESRVFESWTSDRRIAEVFAGLRRFDPDRGHPSLMYDEITDAEINAAVDKYNKTGFTSFRGKKYKKNKTDPQYYDIYDRRRNYVTDGEDLKASLKSEQKDLRDANKDIKNRGKILEKAVDIDKIIWITNRLKSKEFIVKVG